MILVKRTSTFHVRVIYNPREGELPTLTNVALKSSVKTKDNQVHVLTLEKAGDGLSFTVQADTSTWALGCGAWDIRFSADGLKWFSQTYPIEVEPSVTI
jgi:hypothetical protein